MNEGLSTRANSVWKQAQFVIAYEDKGDYSSIDISKYLSGWHELTRGEFDQHLVLQISEDEWVVYDKYGVEKGRNEQGINYLKTVPQKPTIRKSQSSTLLGDNIKEIEKDFPFHSALRTKPFMLLAGISGTGKSRIVKEMAFHTCPNMTELRKDKVAPGNYQLLEVKPNWHDSSELLGYESALKNTYVVTNFVKFLCKAMKYPNVPFFVCLDEMNLAPVEQYFAEFLSVLESRKKTDDGISSEALIPADVFAKYDLLRELFNIKEAGARNTSYTADQTTEASAYYGKEATIYDQLKNEGLRIPANLIVIGTVNMDETTHQFSRKVIDRAMTIEMNEVNFGAFFTESTELDYLDEPLNAEFFLSKYVSAKEAMADLSEEEQTYLFENVPAVLVAINEALDGTPFKVAYRVQNELIIYYAELRDTNADGETADLFKTAVDDILMLKVLPRVEGDKDILEEPLKRLSALAAANGYEKAGAKLQEMSDRLANSPFTSFWP